MSVQAISWAFSVEGLKPGAKFVLVALANYADAQGVCWPSQERIAVETCQSVDTVQRRLSELVKLGLIERERRASRNGHRKSDRYHLTMPKPQSAVLDKSAPKTAEKSRAYTAGGPEPKPHCCGLHTDEPSIEPSYKKQPHQYGKGRKGLAVGARRKAKPPDTDRGETERTIAERLGPDGWDLLMELPPSEVDHLCSMQRRGILHSAKLNELRENHHG